MAPPKTESILKKKAAILQFFGIGDIIFSQTIAQRFKEAGYHILWPVMPQFVDGLRRAYPTIEFTDFTKETRVDFDCRIQKVHNGLLHIPIRWSMEIMGVPYSQVMRAKFDMYGWDWQDWKQHGKWLRDGLKELQLMKHLGIKEGDEYILTNPYYRSDGSGMVTLPKFDCKVVQMKGVPGYSLFDWMYIAEHAKELHVVNSAILYCLELLPLTMPIHLYKRTPEERDFKNVDYLFTKPYILH
jgi:hypothetical protein